MDIFGVYEELLKIYGPQKWWPIIIYDLRFKISDLRVENDLTYGIPYNYLLKLKNRVRDPYFEIAVGAILTQSAAWKNAALAMNYLYEAKALAPEKILDLSNQTAQRWKKTHKLSSRRVSPPWVEKQESLPPKYKIPAFAGMTALEYLIRPAGYYKQKAKKLKIFSRWLVDNYDGDIRKLKKYKLQDIRCKLLALWGIGPETADSIILYALNKPIFVIDEYTRRLCAKFGIKFKTYDEYQKFFELSLRAKRSNPTVDNRAKGLPRPLRGLAMTQLYKEYHALIVASGKDKHSKLLLCHSCESRNLYD